MKLSMSQVVCLHLIMQPPPKLRWRSGCPLGLINMPSAQNLNSSLSASCASIEIACTMKPNANYGRVTISGVTKTLAFIRSSSNSRAALNVLLSITDLTVSSANSVHRSYPTQHFFTNLCHSFNFGSSYQRFIRTEVGCNRG